MIATDRKKNYFEGTVDVSCLVCSTFSALINTYNLAFLFKYTYVYQLRNSYSNVHNLAREEWQRCLKERIASV